MYVYNRCPKILKLECTPNGDTHISNQMNDAYARETSKLARLRIENSFCSCTHIFLNTFGPHFTKCSYLNNYQHLKFGSKYKMFTI